MEVKRFFQYQSKQNKLEIDQIVKEYYESSASSDKIQKVLENTSNLNDLIDRTEIGVINSLSKRIEYGVPYTYVGKDLISIYCEYPGYWYFNKSIKENLLDTRPHPYSIGTSAYVKMKETAEDQVVCLIGTSGSGKTFNAIHVLDHIISLSTKSPDAVQYSDSYFEILHRSIQVLHIMGSVMKKHNLESTSCAFDISIHFDQEFRCVGSSIQASLLDISLPLNKKGRTYQILHSILYCDKNTLKLIGLCDNIQYKIFQGSNRNDTLNIIDNEVNIRFFECLSCIGISNPEKKSFLEVLASVVLLYEVEFGFKNDSIEPRNRSAVKKICKLLGLQENFFIEKFSAFGSKKECEKRIKDFAGYLYSLMFDWINSKINTKLQEIMKLIIKERKESISKQNSLKKREQKDLKLGLEPKFKITILDFPGFTKEKTLGGLGVNLAFESLNYYCSTSYIQLLSRLSSEKVQLSSMVKCRSKEVVEFFMANPSNFMTSLCSNDQEFKKFKKNIENNSLGSDVIEFLNDEWILVKFSWGEVRYNLDTLREEALKHFYGDFNALVLKNSVSVVLKSCIAEPLPRTQRLQPNFEEKYTKSLRKILFQYLDKSPWIIYCVKSDIKGISRQVLQTIRKTLIFPNLIWEWYGYSHWIPIKNILSELSIDAKSIKPSQIKLQLQKIFGWEEFEVTKHYVLLKTREMKDFKEFVDKKFRTPEQSISDLSLTLSLFSSPEKEFKVNVYEDSEVFYEPEDSKEICLSNSFKFVDIDKLYPQQKTNKSDLLDIQTPKESSEGFKYINKYQTDPKKSTEHSNSFTRDHSSVNSNPSDSFTVVNSSSISKKIIRRHIDYKKVDYSNYNHQTILIQKLWRGHNARLYVDALRKLNKNAIIIQSAWKGYSLRKYIQPMLIPHKAACKIQKHWKIYFSNKVMAAQIIQKWFRKLKAQEKSYEEVFVIKPTAKKIISVNSLRQKDSVKSQLDLKTHKNYSRLESKNSSEIKNESTSTYKTNSFTPTISEKSKIIAQKKLSGYENLSLADRFKILEANRLESIHKQRQIKIENDTFSHAPTINPSDLIKNTFEERKEIYLRKYRARIERNPPVESTEECTFKPFVRSVSPTRNYEETVQHLYNWAKIKERKISKAREEKLDKEKDQIVGFKLSANTLKYSANRRNKIDRVDKIKTQVELETSPYWTST